MNNDNDCHILLQNGNKRNKKIDFHNVLDYAEELSEPDLSRPIRAYETSAKTGENVDTLFADVARDFIDDPRSTLTEFNKSLKLDEEDSSSQKRNKSCCLFS